METMILRYVAGRLALSGSSEGRACQARAVGPEPWRQIMIIGYDGMGGGGLPLMGADTWAQPAKVHFPDWSERIMAPHSNLC
jgi:hypothetical protein